jgi:hypothetical protein
VTIQLPFPAVYVEKWIPHRSAGGRTVPNTLFIFQRAELAVQAAKQHGGAERLGVGVGKAYQCLDVPVGERFGGLTGRAAVTAHHQHAEAEPLVDQRDQDQGLGPASGDAGQGSADPVGVLDQPTPARNNSRMRSRLYSTLNCRSSAVSPTPPDTSMMP